MLLGQNVNSYGADFFKKDFHGFFKNQSSQINFDRNQITKFDSRTDIHGSFSFSSVLNPLEIRGNPVIVKHLGRYRIPTLFPQLLDTVARLGFEHVNFMSSNPWDFSDELIEVIAKNKNITRTIHLPVQSGDDSVLKRMNRWYTAKQYSSLVDRIRARIPGVKFTTDIIVGFPGETEAQFKKSILLCRKVGFDKAYISLYSPRPLTVATKNFPDNVPHAEKKKRWKVLDTMINKKSQ